MNANTTLTWEARDGRSVEISVHGCGGQAYVVAKLDGEHFADGVPQLFDAPKGPNGEGVAHLGQLGLTRDRYDAIMAMLADHQATLDADPFWQHEALCDQRQDLVSALDDAEGEQHDADSDRIEAMGRTGVDPGRADNSAKIAAAAAALKAFDAAHPDLLPRIKADRAAQADRQMWH